MATLSSTFGGVLRGLGARVSCLPLAFSGQEGLVLRSKVLGLGGLNLAA